MKTKKAFTLIEVIVVIVVLGALVLMATANNKSALKDAQLTQIKADTATIETNNKKNNLLGNSAINKKVTRTKEDLDKTIKDLDAKVYSKKGLVADLPQDDYFTTTYTENSTNGKLQGTFVIGKTNQAAYYISKKLDLLDTSTYITDIKLGRNSYYFPWFYTLTGQFTVMPVDNKVTVEVGKNQGDPKNRKYSYELTNKNFYKLGTDEEDGHGILIDATDGDKCWLVANIQINEQVNTIVKEVKIPYISQTSVHIGTPRAGRNYIRIRPTEPDTEVTVTIYNKWPPYEKDEYLDYINLPNEIIVEQKTVKINDTKDFTKIMLDRTLQKGDFYEIVGRKGTKGKPDFKITSPYKDSIK